MQQHPVAPTPNVWASPAHCISQVHEHLLIDKTSDTSPMGNPFTVHQTSVIKKSNQHQLGGAALDPDLVWTPFFGVQPGG